jgi:hypothetical protein
MNLANRMEIAKLPLFDFFFVSSLLSFFVPFFLPLFYKTDEFNKK